MQHKEQPFESLCAFLQEQEAKSQLQQSKNDAMREQFARVATKKVYEQEARLDRISFCLFVLFVVCACNFLYMLTL